MIGSRGIDPVASRGTCVWMKEEGSDVYQNEEIGYLVVSKDFRMPLRSPIDGTIAQILCSVRNDCFGVRYREIR